MIIRKYILLIFVGQFWGSVIGFNTCSNELVRCSLEKTCCPNAEGSYSCCPTIEATCCADGLHCCPKNTTCDLRNFTCISTRPIHPSVYKKVHLGDKYWRTCELARELYKNHGFPLKDQPNWMCLVEHESDFDSGKINYNTGGSIDYGIFQINDNYWCGGKGKANGCHVDCEALISDDISASAKCAMTVYQDKMKKGPEHNGFLAWYGWINHCSHGEVKPTDLDYCLLAYEGNWTGQMTKTAGRYRSSPMELICKTHSQDASCHVKYSAFDWPDYGMWGDWNYRSSPENGIEFHQVLYTGDDVYLTATVTATVDEISFEGMSTDNVTWSGTLTRVS